MIGYYLRHSDKDLWARAMAMRRTFSGFAQVTATLFNAPNFHLRNQTGTHIIWVFGLRYHTLDSGSYQYGRRDASMPSAVTVTTKGNLSAGGPASVATFQTLDGSAQLSTGARLSRMQGSTPSNYWNPLPQPYRIGTNQGFIVTGSNFGTPYNCMMFWAEIPIGEE